MSHADIGIVGLGVMGAALARNFHSRGLTVATYNREPELTAAFARQYGDDRYVLCDDYAAFVAALQPPRRILTMVTAGKAVDAVLEAVAPHLAPDDIVIDGGNSFFADTQRRDAWCRARGFRFVGMGVSGGEEGALRGPAMMPGGDPEAWQRLQPVLELACARSDSGPCVAYCGQGGAGHFVKMVHNGIEYGDMQLIAEVWTLLREGLGLDATATAQVFAEWNATELESYLIEVTALVSAAQDPQGPSLANGSHGALVDAILDVAGQKGTGRWTSTQAIELGVPLPTVTAAVDARALSALPGERQQVAAAFGARAREQLTGVDVDDLRHALYAAKLMSYTQGCALLQAGSREHGFGTDLAAVARIWKAGCIIRARLLERIHAAYTAQPDLPLLLLDPAIRADIERCLPAWRRVVARAAEAGVAVPALAASLTYFDTLATARGSARLIQGLRDCFGAHTYQRIDAPGVAVHSAWADLPRL
jgi:6-phosphogluconate dehydrogenase